MNNLTSFSVPWRQTRMNSSGLVQSCLFDIKLSETPCPRQFLIRTFWSSSPSLWWSTYIERMQLGSISDLHAWARFQSLNWNAMHPLRTPTDLTVAFIHSAKPNCEKDGKGHRKLKRIGIYHFSCLFLWSGCGRTWTHFGHVRFVFWTDPYTFPFFFLVVVRHLNRKVRLRLEQTHVYNMVKYVLFFGQIHTFVWTNP